MQAQPRNSAQGRIHWQAFVYLRVLCGSSLWPPV